MDLNLVWGIVMLLVNFSLVLVAYRYFGKIGLFAWIAIASILANIQVVKTIEIFTLEATLGNIMYGSIFLATDLLNEKYGSKVANRSVFIGFFALITSLVSMQIALQFIPSAHDSAHGALQIIFTPALRIVLGSLSAYLVSQLLDILIFAKIRKKLPSIRFLWIRNNASTMLSKLVDTLIFVSIAFIGVFPWSVLPQIYLTTYFLGVIIAALDTPFLYLACKMKPQEDA